MRKKTPMQLTPKAPNTSATVAELCIRAAIAIARNLSVPLTAIHVDFTESQNYYDDEED